MGFTFRNQDEHLSKMFLMIGRNMRDIKRTKDKQINTTKEC